MTIGKKISGGYFLIIFFLVVVTVIAFYSLSVTRDTYSKFIDHRQELIHNVDAIRFEVRDQVAHFRGYILYPEVSRYTGELEENNRRFKESINKIKSLELSYDEIASIEGIENSRERFIDIINSVVKLMEENKKKEALDISLNNVPQITNELVDKAEELKERELKLQSDERTTLRSTVDGLLIVMWVSGILAVLCGILISYLLTRNITVPIKKGVAQLSSSVSEILAMTTQVATGAEETAAAVSETTSTVEEVKQTAQIASQKAKSVSTSAQKASEISKSGRAAVEEAVSGMDTLQQQMESIAQSIVKLSEQSQAIGEIIAIVNDLAEQSNLLAVNAAIEAARAGEQGKGFNVVAQEIKSLAEQSKQSTLQVKAILGDIQKATGESVMTTEQGSKAVIVGVEQAKKAGEAIRHLSDNINEATQAAMQIAASSQQQLVGIDQVTTAMQNINQASSQNVAGTKQAESAAQMLNKLGQELKSLIESN